MNYMSSTPKTFLTTYHSKIYLLENTDVAWCAIGSNNLTGGGLWTNFESCSVQIYHLPDETTELNSIYSLIKKYKDPNYECSAKITSIDDINALFEANYISKEITQKISNITKRISSKKRQKKTALLALKNFYSDCNLCS